MGVCRNSVATGTTCGTGITMGWGILVAPHILLHLGDSPACSLKHGNSPSCKSRVLSALTKHSSCASAPRHPLTTAMAPKDVNGGVMQSAQRRASQSTVSTPDLALTAPTDYPYASQHCKQGILPQISLVLETQKLTISSTLLEPSPATHSSDPIQKRPPLFFRLGILGSSREPHDSPGDCPTPVLKRPSPWLLTHGSIPHPTKTQRMNLYILKEEIRWLTKRGCSMDPS